MESRTNIAAADWWSRIISIASLAMAIGCVVYLRWNESQVTDPPEQLVTDVQSRLDQQVTEYRQDFEKKQTELDEQYRTALQTHDDWLTKQWNEQLGKALEGFEQAGTQLLQRMESDETKAKEDRELAFRRALDAIDSAPELAETDTPFADDPLTPSPLLQLASTRMRPGSSDGTLIRIENSGADDALITRIRFQPEADFQVEAAEQGSSILQDAGNIVTLAYDSSDNTSAKPDMHGIYDRTVTTPIRVPAGGDVTMRVLIEDGTHVGWGFTGTLQIDYNGQAPLTVKAARVSFQRPMAAEMAVDSST